MGIDLENIISELESVNVLTRFQHCSDYQFTIEVDGNTYRRERSRYICFGTFLAYFLRYEEAKGKITCFLHRLKYTNYNNYLWMTEKQLVKHMNYCKTELNLDFDLSIEGDYNVELKINLDLTRLQNLNQIKFVLFWLRYTYEYPSATAMIDAYLLKEKYYPEEELYNLLTITTRTWIALAVNNTINQGQSLGTDNKFISKRILLDRLHSNKYDALVNVFTHGTYTPLLNDWYFKIRNLRNLPNIHLSELNSYIRDWFGYQERFSLYEELYKKLKPLELK